MPPAHRPGTDHAHALDRDERGVGGDVVDLVGGALGEKVMPHRGRLGAGHQLHEQLALALDAFGVGQFARGLDRLDRGVGRIETADLARLGVAKLVEDRGVLHAVLVLRALARTRDRLADLAACKSDRVGLEAVFAHDGIDQSDGLRLLGGNRIAAHDQRQRGFGADQARHALGARGAGDEAQFHFGQAQLRARHRDPVMARERDLAPAAQRGAVDRGNHGLVARFHRVERLGQARAHRGLAELGDVGPGKKRASVTADDDGLDAVVGEARLDLALEPRAHRLAERVDRRVVRHDDEDVAFAVGGNGIGHLDAPQARLSVSAE